MPGLGMCVRIFPRGDINASKKLSQGHRCHKELDTRVLVLIPELTLNYWQYPNVTFVLTAEEVEAGGCRANLPYKTCTALVTPLVVSRRTEYALSTDVLAVLA
jgi:hypothetical protein